MANDMDKNPRLPQRMPDLPEHVRLMLAGMRMDEVGKLRYLLETFTMGDLETINANLENLRSMKRFGKFSFWFFGFIVAGAGAAAAVKTFFIGWSK